MHFESLKKLARSLRRRLPAGRSVGLPSAVDETLSPEEVVDLGHRLLLGRPPDASLRAGLLADLKRGRTPGDVWAEIASSPELAARVKHQSGIVAAVAAPNRDGLIDVVSLGEARSVEQHNESADQYFASLDAGAIEGQLAKPFSSMAETAELLTCFGHVVSGLRPLPGMVLLDFGAGTGWTSHFFAQLGCQVVVSDVSSAALELARERFRRWPPAGGQPQPQFLRFDGHHLELADSSVDRICCFDVFHHLINQAEVMAEFARVLKPGALMGFSEPGRYHSWTGQSQYEMREHGVVEGDIDLSEIAAMTDSVGLEFIAADVLTVAPTWAGLDEFNDLVETRVLTSGMQQQLAQQISNKQLFLLRKPGTEVRDSRDPAGLSGVINLKAVSISHTLRDVAVEVSVEVENTGDALWLPSAERFGGVSIGLKGIGAVAWEGRIGLPSALSPGTQLALTDTFTIPADRATDTVTLALVSEGVAWFDFGKNPVNVRLNDPTI